MNAAARRILISGSSGLVGRPLAARLRERGDFVVRLVRGGGGAGAEQLVWHPQRGELDGTLLEGMDAVVHLAGENIAAARWSAGQKRRLRDSRVAGTRLLAQKLAECERPPRTFMCASAVGYYGDRGDETLDETAAAGEGFLPDVCRQWEASCEPLLKIGTRVVHLRIGVVLSPDGGALAKMLTPFRLGVGGRLGSGRQWMSWIALDDTVAAIVHCLDNEAIAGPVNLGAPSPVTNAEFTKTLGRVLRRPTVFPAPALALRLAFGEMADALLLASTKMEPTVLEQTGYAWKFRDLEPALRYLLGK
jgi:hypothetical protein